MKKDIIQFSHANGFPGSTYASLFSYLQNEFEIRYIDMLGHLPQYPVTNNWSLLVDELIDNIEHQHSRAGKKLPVIGMGHSLGAAITFFAAIRKPELFKALVLLDAPIFAYPKAQIIRFLKKIHRIYWITPAGSRTLRRRRHWPSYEGALEYFRSRPLFKNFSETALHDFVTYGTVPDSEGGEGRVLKFDPKVEAEIYQTLPHTYHEHRFKLQIPTVAIIGKNSGITHRMDMRFMEKFFNVRLKITAGGHLFPFEYPAETAKIVKESIHELLTIKG